MKQCSLYAAFVFSVMAISAQPAHLLITTTPPGATIFINNQQSGLTPFRLDSTADIGILLRIEMKRYYPLEDFVDLKNPNKNSIHFDLISEYSIQSQALVYYGDAKQDDLGIQITERRITELKDEFDQIVSKGKSKALEYITNYPMPKSPRATETTAIFQARSERYSKEKARVFKDIDKKTGYELGHIRRAIEEMRVYITKTEFRTNYKNFSGSHLNMGKYNPDSQSFPAHVRIKEGDFDFSFEGRLKIPQSIASDVKANRVSRSISLEYMNKLIKLSLNGQEVYTYPFPKALKLYHKRKPFAFEGNFILPPYIINSPEYKKAFEVSVLFQKSITDKSPSNDMVKIPAGCFDMGDKRSNKPQNNPVHRVCLDSFWIDKTEVTQADYHIVTDSTLSHFLNCPDCPVENVIWSEANHYCEQVGKRLPTEAEWEYAARAGTETRFYTGDCISTNEANYNGYLPADSCPKGDYRAKPLPVKSFPPNPWGLYDMFGNVNEWVNDWYDAYHYKTSPEKNPTGPSRGKRRIVRGGSWYTTGESIGVAIRMQNGPTDRYYTNGFRCVKD